MIPSSSPSPAVSPKPRGRRSCAAPRSSISFSAPRPITGFRKWWPAPPAPMAKGHGGACWTPNFRSSPSSISCPRRPRPRDLRPIFRCRKAVTSSAPFASCPTPGGRNTPDRRRTCLTRRAGWSHRGRWRSCSWARTSTPITAPRPAGREANGASAGSSGNWRKSAVFAESATPRPIPRTWTRI